MVAVISKADNVYIRVNASREVRSALETQFARFVKGYRFQPKYKEGLWDGKIRFYSATSGLIYAGLIHDVIEQLQALGEKPTFEDGVKGMFKGFDPSEYLEWLVLSAHGKRIEFRDYQKAAIVTALKQSRRLIQSPTSSGKSSVIYGIVRALLDVEFEREKVLVVVPNISLVNQLKADFKDYSTLNEWDVEANVSVSTSKDKDKFAKVRNVLITTWQSIYKLDREWFDQFGALIVDEVHQATAKSLVEIGKKCQARYRIGLSGSIDSDDTTSEMTLRGLFGAKYVATTTKDLMAEGTVAQLNVVGVQCQWGHIGLKGDYQHEIKWLAKQQMRNDLIMNKANELEGNVLILFSLVEAHGKVLQKMGEAASGGKEVFFVYGGVAGEERERIRKLAESHKGCIILASYQTFSTGINIRNINHIIFASPTKSFTRVIQSIGRGLRTSERKTHCTVWDVFDEIDGGKNYTYKHFLERVEIYIKEGFEYDVQQLELKAND